MRIATAMVTLANFDFNNKNWMLMWILDLIFESDIFLSIFVYIDSKLVYIYLIIKAERN